MTQRYTTNSKQVLCDGLHFADGVDEAAASLIATALNDHKWQVHQTIPDTLMCPGCRKPFPRGTMHACTHGSVLVPGKAHHNPCEKIFEHKWLDPECVEKGCSSLKGISPENLRAALHAASLDPKSTRDEQSSLGLATYYVTNKTLTAICQHMRKAT